MVKLVQNFGLQDALLASFYTETDVSLTTHSGKRAVLEFANGYEIALIGRGLTFEGLALTGGTLDRIVFRDAQGNAIASASQLKGLDAFTAYDVITVRPEITFHPVLFGGNDSIFGSGGNDELYGYGGRDKIRGNAGDDTLRGGGGIDMLIGGNGGDALDGGNGRDVLIGGTGADTFVMSLSNDHDVVRDFDAEGNDHDWILNDTSRTVSWQRDGDDILLTFGNDSTLRLIDVRPSQFSEDFIIN